MSLLELWNGKEGPIYTKNPATSLQEWEAKSKADSAAYFGVDRSSPQINRKITRTTLWQRLRYAWQGFKNGPF